MQKFNRIVRRLALYVKRRKAIFVPLGCLVLGVVLGAGLTMVLADDNLASDQSTYTTKNSPLSKSSVDRLARARENSLKRIERDVKNERLSEAQAQKVREKIEELYTSSAETNKEDNISEAGLTLRKELREWAKTEGVSTRYFVGLW